MKRIGDYLPNVSVPISTTSPSRSDPVYACEVCKDAGWTRLDVPVGHPHFAKLWPCQCTLRKREEEAQKKRLVLSNLERFERHTFENYEPTPGTDEAYDAASAYAQDPDGWLFLHGGCGVGKTHLAVAAAREISTHNSSVIFTVVPDLLDHLRATFDPANGVAYDDRFNAFRNAFLLVLDDLGTENTTPWAREKLFQIINHRYNERLPTIITSNQDLAKIDERVVSRLLDRGLTVDIEIDAEDYRRRGRPDYVRGRSRRSR